MLSTTCAHVNIVSPNSRIDKHFSEGAGPCWSQALPPQHSGDLIFLVTENGRFLVYMRGMIDTFHNCGVVVNGTGLIRENG